MREKIEVDVEMINNATAVIHLSGDVTSFAEEVITSAYKDVVDSSRSKVIFHFQESDYINSSGLAILIGLVTQARKNNHQLYMAVPSSHFQKMFRAVGLTDYSTIYPSLEEALAEVG